MFHGRQQLVHGSRDMNRYSYNWTVHSSRQSILHTAEWYIYPNFLISLFIKSLTLFVHINNITSDKYCLQSFLLINGIKFPFTFRINPEQMSPILPFLILSRNTGKRNGINITCLKQIYSWCDILICRHLNFFCSVTRVPLTTLMSLVSLLSIAVSPFSEVCQRSQGEKKKKDTMGLMILQNLTKVEVYIYIKHLQIHYWHFKLARCHINILLRRFYRGFSSQWKKDGMCTKILNKRLYMLKSKELSWLDPLHCIIKEIKSTVVNKPSFFFFLT